MIWYAITNIISYDFIYTFHYQASVLFSHNRIHITKHF